MLFFLKKNLSVVKRRKTDERVSGASSRRQCVHRRPWKLVQLVNDKVGGARGGGARALDAFDLRVVKDDGFCQLLFVGKDVAR